MKIKCISNSVKDIPLDFRYFGESDKTSFSFLNIHEEFTVYGLISLPNRVEYLICQECQNPIWVPANLFEILDNTLPNNWSLGITSFHEDYKHLDKFFDIKTIISYPKLVNSYSHYEGIIEREPDDLYEFFIKKGKYRKTNKLTIDFRVNR